MSKSVLWILALTTPLLAETDLTPGLFHPDITYEMDFGEHKTDEIASTEVNLVRKKRNLPNIYFPVVLDPNFKTDLYAEVNSPIIEVTKKIGDVCEEGELLIQLDDAIFESSYTKAKAFFIKAQTELESTQQLFDEGLASLYELNEAKAAVAEEEANLILAEKNLNATRITAPYSGKIAHIFVETFELPQKGKELIRIIDDDKLVAKLLLSSDYLELLSIGLPMEITVTETGETVLARVARIAGMIDPSSSTIQIEAEIENQQRNLTAGMTGSARFIQGFEG